MRRWRWPVVPRTSTERTDWRRRSAEIAVTILGTTLPGLTDRAIDARAAGLVAQAVRVRQCADHRWSLSGSRRAGTAQRGLHNHAATIAVKEVSCASGRPGVVVPEPRRRREPAGRPSAAGHDGASARRRHRLRPVRHPTRRPPHRARGHRRGMTLAQAALRADRLGTGDVEVVVGEEQVAQRPVAVGAARRSRVPSGSSSNVSSSAGS